MSRVYQQSATGKCTPQNAPRTDAVGGRHDAIVVFLNTQNDYKYELCADSGPEFSVLIAGERATLILRLGVARGSRRGPLTCSGRWTWPGPLKHRGARVVGPVRATVRPTTARLWTELINTKRNDRLCLSHQLTQSTTCCMQYGGTQNLYSTLPRGGPILTTSTCACWRR